MGAVWVADHLSLHTQVVVKFIAVELAGRLEAMQRFSREAAAAAQVKSPHVVQMFDHGVTQDGVAFIVMELLEGRDLAHHIAARGRLSVSETAEIIAQTCKALSRAHERGIVHRDIKPDNIFMCASPDGDTFVKLLDFGIAKGDFTASASTGTKTGATIGTPFYMSPEQMMGAKDVDGRADLWSLGVVAFECVLGTRPFQGDTFGAVAIHIHSGPIPVPSSLDPGLPPAFDAWFARACARNLAERFASAKEFADTLLYIASGGSTLPGGFRSSAPPMTSPAAYTAGPTPLPGVGTPVPGLGNTPHPGVGAPYPGVGTPHPGVGTPHPGVGTPHPGLGAAAVSGGRTISHAGMGLPTPLPTVPGARRTGGVIAIAIGLMALAGAGALFAVRSVISPSPASSTAASAGSAPTAARLAASSAPAPIEPPAVSLTLRPSEPPPSAEPASSPPVATDAAPPTPKAKPQPPPLAAKPAAPPPHAAPKPTPSKNERDIF
jgi:serine/threonine-protein kinase